MPRPKKGDPELLLVSFCDIVTIVTAALFMAMIVVIDESSRIPSIRPMPMLRSTTNAPVYFECREGQIFPIDYTRLTGIFHEESKKVKQATAAQLRDDGVSAVSAIMKIQAGGDLYQLDPHYLLMGIMALTPKEGTHGTTEKEIIDSPKNEFRAAIDKLNRDSQFCAFIVRDDSFAVFRRARELASSKRFDTGWEMLDRNERITFAGAVHSIGVQ
jgi:hypothetical protein